MEVIEMSTQNELVGYIRLSKAGNALKLNILKSALDRARTVEGKDGTEYVSLIMNLDKIRGIIEGAHELTGVCTSVEEEQG